MTGHPLDGVERKPRTCIWEITGACNLRCVHCESRCGEPGARELSMDQLLGTAEALARLGCRNVDVTGGEPLVRAGWDRLCRRLSDLGIKVTLVTNGILLDGDALGRALAAGVSSVSISLDGPKKVHDATRLRPRPGGASPWEETMAAIRLAVGRIDTSVITQVNRTNIHELPAMGRLCRAGCTSMAYWVTGTIHENPYCLLALERKRVCT